MQNNLQWGEVWKYFIAFNEYLSLFGWTFAGILIVTPGRGGPTLLFVLNSGFQSPVSWVREVRMEDDRILTNGAIVYDKRFNVELATIDWYNWSQTNFKGDSTLK